MESKKAASELMHEGAKKFFVHLGLQFVLDAVKGFIVKSLEQVKAVDLIKAINEDMDLWENIPAELRNNIDILKKRYEKYLVYLKGYRSMITADVILQLLREKKPHIASLIINTNGGTDWLQKQIDIILFHLIDGD